MKAGNRSNEPDMSSEVSIIRIPPHHYIHVLDQNTNIARIEVGPLTYIRQDNERSDWAGSGSGSGSGWGPGLGLGPGGVWGWVQVRVRVCVWVQVGCGSGSC